MANEKTLFQIYATPNNDNTANIAGPLTIVATLDTIQDLYDPEVLDDKNIDGVITQGLRSIIQEAIDNGNEYPVIYIEQVFNVSAEDTPTELKFRGAYYIFKKWILQVDGVTKNPLFSEILIGSDGFTDADAIKLVSKLDVNGENKGFIEVFTNSEDETDIKLTNIPLVPSLPEFIQEQGKAHETVKNWDIPTTDTIIHLDANLDELGPVGNIQSPDHNFTAQGSCQALYEALYSSVNNVIIVKKENDIIQFDISPKEGNIHQTVYLKDMTTDYSTMEYNPTNNKFRLATFEQVVAPGIDYDTVSDFILISINGEFVPSYNFNINYDNLNKILSVNILDSYIKSKYQYDEFTITALIIKNNILTEEEVTLSEIYEAIDITQTITLNSIKNLMYRLYTMNEIENIEDPDFVYLTNDVYGNIVWDNKFTPSNNFKTIHRQFNYDDPNIDIVGNVVNINLGQQTVKIDSTLLAFLDNYFVYDASCYYDTDLNFIITFIPPENELYWEPDKITFQIMVVSVSDGASDTIYNLAKDYLTKKDAINILSKGTISLDQYVKKTDLVDYSKIGHTHGSYAPNNHTHDYRYAEYWHTHPELIDQNGNIAVDISEQIKSNVQQGLIDSGWDIDNKTIQATSVNTTEGNLADVLVSMNSDIKGNKTSDTITYRENTISAVNVGGFKVGDRIPYNIEDILDQLFIQDIETYQSIPDHIEISLYVKTGEDFIEIENIHKDIDSENIYIKIHVVDKAGKICTDITQEVKINETVPFSLNEYYNLGLTGDENTFDHTFNIDVIVDKMVTATESNEYFFNTIYNVKAIVPTIIYTSNDTNFDPDVEPDEMTFNMMFMFGNKSYSEITLIDHNMDYSRIMFCIQDGLDFEIYDTTYNKSVNAYDYMGSQSSTTFTVNGEEILYDFYTFAIPDNGDELLNIVFRITTSEGE